MIHNLKIKMRSENCIYLQQLNNNIHISKWEKLTCIFYKTTHFLIFSCFENKLLDREETFLWLSFSFVNLGLQISSWENITEKKKQNHT